MTNNIRITKESIAQTDNYSKDIYFVDEVAGNESSNLASFDTLAEANRYGMNIAKEYNLLFCGHNIGELINAA